MSGEFTEAIDTGQGDEEQSVAVVNFKSFLEYLQKVLAIQFHEDVAAPPSLLAAIEDPNNQDCMNKFISDSQVSALLIQKFTLKGKPTLQNKLQVRQDLNKYKIS